MGFEPESEAIGRRGDRSNVVDMKPPGQPTGAHGTAGSRDSWKTSVRPTPQLMKARLLIYRVVLHGNPVKTVVRSPGQAGGVRFLSRPRIKTNLAWTRFQMRRSVGEVEPNFAPKKCEPSVQVGSGKTCSRSHPQIPRKTISPS